LTRKLGIRGSEFVEVYDIEPWAIDHLHPHGLIFCFLWHKDVHRAIDFEDPSSERVWFANQLIDDACASQAILNVVLNCPGIDIGHDCTRLKQETEDMSPAVSEDLQEVFVTKIRLIISTDERACNIKLHMGSGSPQLASPVRLRELSVNSRYDALQTCRYQCSTFCAS
jgi:hypothetical protein